MGTVDIQRADQDVGVDLAGVARLLADGTRAAFCLALLDGRAWTANELARYAGVAPSTATSHLNLLVNGGLLVEERHGRHRYVRVADRRVVELIESLAALAPKHSPGHARCRPPAGSRRSPAHGCATTTWPEPPRWPSPTQWSNADSWSVNPSRA